MMAQIQAFLDELTPDELRRLRSAVNGRLSKRKITREQQAKMQAARRRKL